MNSSILSKSLLFTGALFLMNNSFAQNKDAVLMTIGNSKVTVAEFENVYHKNNNKEVVNDTKSLNDYVDLFVNFKLKVKEAETFRIRHRKSI
ncbi:MAG: hypothetical protein IPH89_11580 [Bacteroidetes bacterium]|nr:hypothetical protein [Bacteroidota bacterium]